MIKPKEIDADILRLWNQNLSVKEIVEQLAVSDNEVRSRLLLIHKVPFEILKERTRPFVEQECPNCHEIFNVRLGIVRTKFCSRDCGSQFRKANKPKRTAEEIAETKQKTAIYMKVQQRDAARDHFEWVERDRIKKLIRKQG